MGLFSFLSRSRSIPDLFNGFRDHHSHILPGVDDGFSDIEDSLKCLEIYETYGFSDVWLTPHIMEDVPNATDALRRKFDEFREAYNGPIKLHLAAENMIDTLFVERLAANDFLPMGDRLLVETSYYTPPVNLYDILDNIRSKGYFPLLAHPERYRYMTKDDYVRLKDMGVEFQLNIFSLVGAYGRPPHDNAHALLKMGAYDTCGTDIHRSEQAQALDAIIRNKNLTRLLQSSGLLNKA